MKWFKSLMAGVSISTLLLATACSGGGGEKADGDNKGSKDKVTIEYWHTYGDQEEKVLVDKIKPLFEKEHPEIELKLTRMPYEGLKQQVIAGVSGDAAPDLMRMDIIWVPEFAEMGALKEVSSMDGFDAVKESVFEGPMATNVFEGKYYGVPVNTNTKVAIYNKAIMDKAGITEAPKTMDEFVAASQKAKDAGAKGAIGIGGSFSWGFLPYFWSLGGELTNEDYTKFDGYLNSPESIKAVEEIAKWQKDKLAAPTLLGGEPGTWDGMKKNEYFMIDDGPWFYSILMNEEGSKFKPLEDTVRGLMPEGKGGSRSVIGGEDLVIFANSKHPEEAWTFAKWMMTTEPQKIMSETGLIPSNKEAANDPEFLKVPFAKEYVEQLKTAMPRTPIPQWSEIEAIINQNFEKVVRGKMSAEDAMNDAAKKADSLLK
ncbi:extracellular solute-binding protein [Mesobacillus subterraneus]|uniref:extracellular solute-binding protein n=1 Tax=Mesobacillus subterraneus TaxID=285983 RepID=UPI00203B4E18|nr:extracellular solute-binding protein [Mesobacillus subterraneus]MCM3665818.1 extracellular solute-binding protein [Mesobacillus subterraneus]MCM3684791.1 extracellular solute-binding protein [Mesobacillus subterraneus]